MNKQNFTLTVFVGDIDSSLSESACKYNSTAFLIDSSNVNDFIQSTLSTHTTVYTSLGDLPKNLQIFVDLCMAADQIFYCPPSVWSDKQFLDQFQPSICIQGLTESLLFLVSSHVPVIGLAIAPLQNPIAVVDSRKTCDPQLWIAGCSISHGLGVEHDQRYGHLLASSLDLQCSYLTRVGSAIDWASDQIIRSDIRPRDIVIFGVTNTERLTYVKNHALLPGVTVYTYKTFPEIQKFLPEHNLITENTFYHHIAAIDRVINFCEKAGASLLLVGLLSQHSPNLMRFLSSKKNFVQYPYKIAIDQPLVFADLGTDNHHPGPIQHSLYANFILKHLKKIHPNMIPV